MSAFHKVWKKVDRRTDDTQHEANTNPPAIVPPRQPSISQLFPNNLFNGMRTLYEPTDANIEIIFLHGLTGRSDQTFLHKLTGTYWPVHLLAQDLPKARISAFGYDADVVNMWNPASQNNLRHHATNLLNDLARIRNPNRPGRFPEKILFVAHSLGGLITKRALALSQHSPVDYLRQIEEDTSGILFLGTPHRGADSARFARAAANIAKMSGWHANTDILGVLERHSEVLESVGGDFMGWVNNKRGRIQLACFYEELPVGMPVNARVVEPESAKIAGWLEQSIHANHMDMARFSGPDDEGYQRVADVLIRWAPTPGNRADSIDSPCVRHDVKNALVACCNKLGLRFDDLLNVPKDKNPPFFPIDEEPLEWFISSLEFQVWQREDGPALLWLHGLPSSGKTVIMSYVLARLPRYLGHKNNFDSAAAFCNCYYSEELVVASLVLQLAETRNDAQGIMATAKPMPPSPTQTDLVQYLWSLLTCMITEAPLRETILLLDGIDHLKPDVRASFLQNFRRLERQAHSSATIRVLCTSKPYPDLQEALSHYVSIDRERERMDCLKTLFFQEWNARETRIEAPVEGGSWLPGHKNYLGWKESPRSDLLWIEGKPGSGKSTLAKKIARRLQNERNLSRSIPSDASTVLDNGRDYPPENRHLIADFYYSFRGGIPETSHELMLRSIVYQLWSQDERLYVLLRDLYRELKEQRGGTTGNGSIWRYDDLKSALRCLHQIWVPLEVFIIVDGMDESGSMQRDDLLRFLYALSSETTKCTFKILVASRPEPDINTELMRCRHIVLQDENMGDVREIVDQKIKAIKDLCMAGGSDNDLSLSRQDRFQDGLSMIGEYIIDNSQGIILWVSLVLKDLVRDVNKGAFTVASLDKRVRRLPKELGGPNGLYREIIDSLVRHIEEASQDDQDREEDLQQGRRILAWVTFPKRPISIRELGGVLATPPMLDDTELTTYDLDRNVPMQLEKGVLSYCGNLVEVRPVANGKIVQLVHQTTRDFLISHRELASPYDLSASDGDLEIASTCCNHLRIAFTPASLQPDPKGDYSQVDQVIEGLVNCELLPYALSNLSSHLDHLEQRDEKIRQDFELFLARVQSTPTSWPALLLKQWIASLGWPQLPSEEAWRASSKACIQSALVWSSRAGRPRAVELLIALQAEVNGSDPHGTFALQAASASGSTDVVQVLLKNNANVNVHGGEYGTALHAASAQGHKDIVKLLLNNGADVNAQGGDYGNALQAACSQGHEEIVKALIEQGADMYAKGGMYSNAFQASSGNEDIVQLLLIHDAETGRPDGNAR
ncbi:uncharacterized protein DSM5745_04337 [Aspergillus mulundensis]|uniref:AAA+ ATPase domain-containing protein n=1 Tax=Aspergillus mulundensis TaxID=1810919 RepID=A0A3D8SCX6_9EURO|nr:hypothetical protein DSM5745_04337 [Aspergillus mulundensis]RDW84011.1 hypothetical protein DSM5745_04337 [Aspergillus mulundensis]